MPFRPRPSFRARFASIALGTALLAGPALGSPGLSVAATNNALSLSGSGQWVTFGPAPGLGAATFTLEAWFNWTGGGVPAWTSSTAEGLNSAIPILTKGIRQTDGSNVDVNWFLGIDTTTRTLAADFEDNAGGGNHAVFGVTPITTGTWHHAAVTYDGATWKVYLDGQLERTLTLSGNRTPRSDSINHAAIGTAMSASGSAMGAFAGLIDEARVWNFARTQAEIQATKDVELTAPAAGLRGYWRLNEGTGTLVSDASGNNVSGAAVGSPSWAAGFAPSTPNAPATATLVSPPNGSGGFEGATGIAVSVADAESPSLSVAFFGRAYASGVFQPLGPSQTVASGETTGMTWSGLRQGQRYEWFVTVSDGTSASTSATWTFDTTPSTDPVLVGAGDIARCADASTNTGAATARILEGVAGDIFTAGDNVYETGTPTEWATCYDVSWGGAPSHQLKARTRPAPGNHDWGTGTLAPYFAYFGTAAGDPVTGRSYYSFDEGAYWHVVVLDSECGMVAGGCSATSPQLAWLRADLVASADRNVIAIWHKPRFSSARGDINPEVQPFWDVAYEYGVDIILAGHDHIYERMVPMNAGGVADPVAGITQFIVGTGGASHYDITTVRSTSVVRNVDTFGVLKLTLHPTSYDWQFLPESGKTFADSGTAQVLGVVNHPPTITSVIVAPPNPTTATMVSASVLASDPDGDALTYAYQWTRNGVDLAGATSSTLDLSTAGNGDRGDVLAVRVTASDGEATTVPTTSAGVAVSNTAPSATVSLTPGSPASDATLTATIASAVDADGDPVTWSFVWRNGSTVVRTVSAPAASADVLDLAIAGNGDAGDAISVTVVPSDGIAQGAPAVASVTVAGNEPPVVDAVALAPTSPTTNVTLSANPTGHDPEGLPLTYAYQWIRNGVDIPGATGSTLDLSAAGAGDRGDLVAVRVVASDGLATSSPFTSTSVAVGNSAPTTSVALAPSAPPTTTILLATATRSDADGDPVLLSYTWRVNGVVRRTTTPTASLTDSLDLLTPGNGDPGDVVTVSVVPSDGTVSGASATASATVVADALPPGAPGSLAASGTSTSIALDWPDSPERDLAAYRVYRGPTAQGPFVQIGAPTAGTSTFVDTAVVTGTLTYRVTAVDSSGNESLPATATFARSIALRSVSSAQSSSTSIAIARPSGVVAGDVLVAVVAAPRTGTISAGAGWAPARSDTSGNGLRQAIYTRVAGAAEPASYTFGLPGGQGGAAILAAYVGVDPASPVQATSFQAGSGTAIVGPSVPATGGVLLMFGGIAVTTTTAPPAAMAERGEVAASGKTKVTLEVADQLLSGSGPTGSRTATAGRAGANIGQLLVLRPKAT